MDCILTGKPVWIQEKNKCLDHKNNLITRENINISLKLYKSSFPKDIYFPSEYTQNPEMDISESIYSDFKNFAMMYDQTFLSKLFFQGIFIHNRK